MAHPNPERLALAALTWARLERILTDAGLLPERLAEHRAMYIRVLVEALEGVPIPANGLSTAMDKTPPDLGEVLSIPTLERFEDEQTEHASVQNLPSATSATSATLPTSDPVLAEHAENISQNQPVTLIQPESTGPNRSQPVWIDRGDQLPWSTDPPVPRSGPGFICRQCGVPVRRARHTDPRLVCQTCLKQALAGASG